MKKFSVTLLQIMFMCSCNIADIHDSKEITPILPTSNFIIQNNECIEPCTISFINKSENALNYEWDFGDRNNSTDKNPIHKYEDGGIYEVILKAFGEGNTEAIKKVVSK